MTNDSSHARGLIVVYTGEGKGKTTAALGAVFRAMGRELAVAVVQFIKGKRMTGERLFADTLAPLTFDVMGRGFTWESDDLSLDRRAALAAWERACAHLSSGEHDLVVLDELTYAVHYGWLTVDNVLDGLRDRAAHTHVIVTGRRAPPELVEAADLVTEMTCIKHPYTAGVPAQRGLDF